MFRGEFSALDLHFIGRDAFSDTPGEVRYETFDGSGLIRGNVLVDVDGDGAWDTLIHVSQPIEFRASDFSF